jgi:hypothetical protein
MASEQPPGHAISSANCAGSRDRLGRDGETPVQAKSAHMTLRIEGPGIIAGTNLIFVYLLSAISIQITVVILELRPRGRKFHGGGRVTFASEIPRSTRSRPTTEKKETFRKVWRAGFDRFVAGACLMLTYEGIFHVIPHFRAAHS